MNDVMRVYELLLRRFGPQHWWPAESAFEMMVGAMLMHQTSWRNVEKAIDNLKRNRMLSPAKIARARIDILTSLVSPAGLYRTKPRRLREFCRRLIEETGGDVDSFLDRERASLRHELLSLEGIGPETADSILLYAAGAKIFVVDAYTLRVGRRVGLFDFTDYGKVQAFFGDKVTGDVTTYQDYHALIVRLAKTICRSKPECGICPLAVLCDYARQRGRRSAVRFER